MRGLGVQGLGCRVECSESMVWGSGFRVQGFGVWGFEVEGLGCRVYSLEFRVSGLGFGVQASRSMVSGVVSKVYG